MTEKEQRQLLAEVLPRYRFYETAVFPEGDILFSRFDSLVTRRYCLFTIGENFDFDRLEANLDLLSECMPALLRIFEKPLIHLREISETVPVEMAVKAGSDTMRHAATHSDIWDGTDAAHLHPYKLMTTKSEDDYTIYENRVFAYVIDRILAYCEFSRRHLSGRIFNSMQLNINLLDRTNHKNYFLALAALHTAYDNSLDTSFERAEKDYKRIKAIENALTPHLRSRVYRLNRGLFAGGEVKSTNILIMHKDYRVLGYLLTRFNSGVKQQVLPTDAELRAFVSDYRRYSAALLLFAASNFGFEAADDAKVDVYAPSLTMQNAGCTLKISTKIYGDACVFLLDFHTVRDYRIILLPYGADTEAIRRKLPKHNETVTLLPYRTEEQTEPLIAIDDVDSFRRFDQILYRGMIYSDGAFALCAFCGSNMVPDEADSRAHRCPSCHTVTRESVCPETEKHYYATTVPGYRLSAGDREYSRDTSVMLRYRNITALTEKGDILCPHCGKIH